MDLLLENFVKKNIHIFTESELNDLENLIKIEDESSHTIDNEQQATSLQSRTII